MKHTAVFTFSLFTFIFAAMAADTRPLVKVGAVTNGVRFVESLRVQGSVRAKNSAVISARLPGAIDAMTADEGDTVKAGQALFKVDQVNLANAVALAKAADIKAQLDATRMARLVKDGAVTKDMFEKADVMAKSTALKLAVAEKNLSDSEVRAPFDGIITRKHKHAGDYVGPGVSVFTMEDPSVYEICLSLNAAQYAKVKVGETKISITSQTSQTSQTLPVTYKSPSVNPATRTFEIRAVVPKSDALASGMIVDCDVILAERNSQALPSTAVALRGGGNCVFKVADGKVVRVGVTAGASANGLTEILAPRSAPGDAIITEGMLLVNEGEEVRHVSL